MIHRRKHSYPLSPIPLYHDINNFFGRRLVPDFQSSKPRFDGSINIIRVNVGTLNAEYCPIILPVYPYSTHASLDGDIPLT